MMPKAYLQYILFDENWNYVASDEVTISSAAASAYEELSLDGVIANDGYLYVYVINESNAYVHFDDLTVGVLGLNVLSTRNYYPYGSVAYEWKNPDFDDRYRFGYQGQFAEEDTVTGWNHFELREYDGKIGRWLVMDPYNQYWSPYLSMGNDPLNLIDPDGGKAGPGQGLWNSIRAFFGFGSYVKQSTLEGFSPNDFDVEKDILELEQVTITAEREQVLPSRNFVWDFLDGQRKTTIDGRHVDVDYNGYATGGNTINGTVPDLPIGPSGGIKITAKGLKHVLSRHTFNSISRYFSKSKFNLGEDVVDLVNRAHNVKPVPQINGNYQRIVNAGRNVGIDMTTGKPTSTYTVITNSSDELITAFPGIPLN